MFRRNRYVYVNVGTPSYKANPTIVGGLVKKGRRVGAVVDVDIEGTSFRVAWRDGGTTIEPKADYELVVGD